MPDLDLEAAAATTAGQAAATPDQGGTPEESRGTPIDNTAVEKLLRAQAETSKTHRRTFHPAWDTNVALRLGHPTTAIASASPFEDAVQSVINPDWALTKTKTANLYSQVPTVQCTHENVQYAKAIPAFAKALNYELSEKRANVGVAMEEVLNDVVNAAGVGAIVVTYQARFEDVEMPAVESLPGPAGPIPTANIPVDQLKAMGIPTTIVPRVVSYKFATERIPPASLLWPKRFVGSCFDQADWMGYTGILRWAEAKHAFHLTDAQKTDACSAVEYRHDDTLRQVSEGTGRGDEHDLVQFDDLYYWRHRVDPDETSFHAIWRIVFIEGLDQAVIHEPWTGQHYDQQSRTYVGACRFPVRVLTLTYVSDNPIPPSDSQAGRPQVNDLQRSRAQMFMNRQRSIPIRWFNSNIIDLEIQEQLNRGTFQGLIPVNGDGARAVGEVARASYPAEDLSFDQVAKADLMESWQIGPNQGGTSMAGRHTKGEAEITQANFQTNIGREKSRVSLFFLGVCEVLAGWMALYSDFPTLSPEEREALTSHWDSKKILHDLVLKIRPDSMIVLDPEQRMDRLERVINFTVKSGFVKPQPLIAEYLEMAGLDPTAIMTAPEAKEDRPQLSFRFSGKDDLTSPTVMGLLIENKSAPSPQSIEAAKNLLMTVQQPPAPPQQPPGMPPPGQPPGTGPGGAPPGPPKSPIPQDAHPNWRTPSLVVDRSGQQNAP